MKKDDDLRTDVQQQIVQARRDGNAVLVDHLLDQLIEIDIAHKFVEQIND